MDWSVSRDRVLATADEIRDAKDERRVEITCCLPRLASRWIDVRASGRDATPTASPVVRDDAVAPGGRLGLPCPAVRRARVRVRHIQATSRPTGRVPTPIYRPAWVGSAGLSCPQSCGELYIYASRAGRTGVSGQSPCPGVGEPV